MSILDTIEIVDHVEAKPKKEEWTDCGVQIPDDLPIKPHPSWKLIDSSKLQAYQSCPRKYFYQYVLGYSPEKPSLPLVYGEAWHRGLAELYKGGFTKESLDAGKRAFTSYYRKFYPTVESEIGNKGKTYSRAMDALKMYCETWETDKYDFHISAVEEGGTVDIGIPLANGDWPTRKIAYRMDAVGIRCRDDVSCIIEHKTASRGGQSWKKQWDLSLQMGTYTYALRERNSTYTDPVPAEIYVNGTIFAPVNTTFERKLVTPTKARLAEWLWQVNNIWSNIERDFERLREVSPKAMIMDAFLKNASACSGYSCCPFHDLCVYHTNPLASKGMPLGMVIRHWNPLRGEE